MIVAFVTVWWHSLWRMFASPPHRMCRVGLWHFCECGYGIRRLPFDVQVIAEQFPRG